MLDFRVKCIKSNTLILAQAVSIQNGSSLAFKILAESQKWLPYGGGGGWGGGRGVKFLLKLNLA